MRIANLSSQKFDITHKPSNIQVRKKLKNNVSIEDRFTSSTTGAAV